MPRPLAVLAVAVVALVLAPAIAQAQDDGGFDPRAACPVDAPEADADGRERVPAAHARNVDCAALLEIPVGTADDGLRPDRRMRRDQMASVVARTLEAAGVALPDPQEGREFSDVGADNPHAESIRRLRAARVVRGGPGGMSRDEYGPALPTRRDQLASVLARARGYAFDEDIDGDGQEDVDGDGQPFDDVADDNVHATAIQAAVDGGLALGSEPGAFSPARPARRDQTASAATRLANALATPAAVRLEGPSGPAEVSETRTVTATVLSQFRDAAGDRARWAGGEPVAFSAEHDRASGAVTPAESQTVEADRSGEAVFSFAAMETGTVTVTAAITGPGGNFRHAGGAQATVAQEFLSGAAAEGTAPPEGVELVPQETTNEAPGEHTVRASLTEDGEQARGRAIRFEVYREGDETFALSEETDAQPRTGVVSTGPDGEPATFTYTFDRELGDGERAEHLVVACEARADDPCVSIISGDFTERPHDTAVKTWVAPGS